MKKGIHPTLNPVIFIDSSTGTEFITRSTLRSKNTRAVDGVEHFLIPMDVTSASHPFYTGQQRALTIAGRVERFNKKYNLTSK